MNIAISKDLHVNDSVYIVMENWKLTHGFWNSKQEMEAAMKLMHNNFELEETSYFILIWFLRVHYNW